MKNHNPTITGTQINYYYVCHRKLWLFSHNISMEHTSEAVEIGSLIHEYSYSRKKKEITIEGIKIDFFDAANGVIHEIKKSKAIEKSHVYQLKYYIHYMRALGLSVTGEIDYPLLKRKERITFCQEDEIEIEKIISDINNINEAEHPIEVLNRPFCKKCSYYELCYV